MKKEKTPKYDRDVDECAAKIKALLKEYNCQIDKYESQIELIDNDTSAFTVIYEHD